MKLKPGIKSSEFYIGLAVAILSAAAGIVEAMGAEGSAAVQVAAILGPVLLALKYKHDRKGLKAAELLVEGKKADVLMEITKRELSGLDIEGLRGLLK